MSRLDSFIRRMQAQRDCLNAAARLIAEVPGPILELGLGNGRTYDHLRELLPARRIYVFERQVQAHPTCIPHDEDLFLGDFRDTLPLALQRIGMRAALVHADYGAGTREYVTGMSAFLAKVLPGMVAHGAVIVSDYPILGEGWIALPLPEGVKPERYFMQRAPF